MGSENQFLTTLHVDALGNLGVYDKKVGGDSSASPKLYRPGGMGPPVAYPVLPVPTTITLTRVYDLTRGDQTIVAQLKQQSGRSGATVTEQPLDQNGNAFGPQTTYRGILGSVKGGDVDSNSDNQRLYMVDVIVTSIAN